MWMTEYLEKTENSENSLISYHNKCEWIKIRKKKQKKCLNDKKSEKKNILWSNTVQMMNSDWLEMHTIPHANFSIQC